MAVFRIEKTRDYTVMAKPPSAEHETLPQSKGLLSLMLSLPEDWDYTTKGLAEDMQGTVWTAFAQPSMSWRNTAM